MFTKLRRKYGKTVLAALAAGMAAAYSYATDGTITSDEWWLIGIAAANAVGVYFAPAVTRESTEGTGGDSVVR